MLTVYLWTYTLFLAIIWWFFIIAKIHTYKFKNFSSNITKVTSILFVFLIILSFLWYFLIFYWLSNTTTTIDDYSGSDTNEVNY